MFATEGYFSSLFDSVDYAYYFEPHVLDIHFEFACFFVLFCCFLHPLALPPPHLPDSVSVAVVINTVCV